MTVYSMTSSGSRKYAVRIALVILWLSAIGTSAVFSASSNIALACLIILLLISFFIIRNHLLLKQSLKDVCNFYQNAHALDDLQLLKNERPYSGILKIVRELGMFDWAVIFLMDYESDRFVAVEASGTQIAAFSDVNFDELDAEKTSDGMALSFKLLEKAFKLYSFKGALAGSPLVRDNTFYGCLLVGRDDDMAILSEEDSFRLDILSDQITICLHNFKLHQELALRAQELFQRQTQIRRELDMARIVQEGALPRTVCAQGEFGVSFASLLKPARFVGGDFLRITDVSSKPDEKQLGILLGDVSGKGVPAALVMAVVVCLFKEKGNLGQAPAQIMKEVNVALKEFLGAGSRFNSTAFYGIFNKNDSIFSYASAGHDHPLIYRAATKELEELPSTGTMLGLFFESEFECLQVKLFPGDRLIIYSDGLVDFLEAFTGCEDGFYALRDFFAENAEKKQQEIINQISQMVEDSPESVKDDITVAVLAI